MAYPGPEYMAEFNHWDVMIILNYLSKKYSHYKFYVKCKNSFQEHCLGIYAYKSGWNNLIIDSKIDNVDLMSKSKVIIGLNSLSILEGLLTKACLVNPFWGDACLPDNLLQIDPNDDLVKKCFAFPDSREKMCDIIEDVILARNYVDIDMQSRLKLFNNYIRFDSDDSCTAKFEHIVVSLIEKEEKHHISRLL